MAHVKKAVSLDEHLFEWTEAEARSRHVPWSRLIAKILEDYRHREETRQLIESYNAVYAEGPDAEEQETLDFIAQHFRHVLQDDDK